MTKAKFMTLCSFRCNYGYKISLKFWAETRPVFTVPCETSVMEPNLKIVNGYKALTTFVKNSMIDVYQGPKYSSSGNATYQLTLTIETPGKSVKYVQN